MSEPIFVIPTFIHEGQSPSGIKFKSFTDANKKTWFVSDEKIMLMLQTNKAYNITSFNESEKGNIITGLELAADRLPQKAQTTITKPNTPRTYQKPIDRTEAQKLVSVNLSYAKDFVINGLIKPDEMYSKASEMLKWTIEQTDKLIKGQ